MFYRIFSFSNSTKAQDTLRLLNGNVITVQIQKVDDREITYLHSFKGRNSLEKRELSTIFSYQKAQQEEVLVYSFNPEIGNIYKVDEMRNFMTGEKHADEFYHSRFTNILGFASGAIAGYTLSQEEEFVLLATPLLYSTIIIIPGSRVKKNVKNEDLIKQEPYRSGYKRVAKGKKFFGALKWSFVGMAASFAFAELSE